VALAPGLLIHATSSTGNPHLLHYIRHRQPPQTFSNRSKRNLFIDILQEQRTRSRLQLDAFGVMPDHTHLLLTPAPDISLEKAMQYIKGGFSFRLKS
jgi:REP element-mobilizing transposase RayT